MSAGIDRLFQLYRDDYGYRALPFSFSPLLPWDLVTRRFHLEPLPRVAGTLERANDPPSALFPRNEIPRDNRISGEKAETLFFLLDRALARRRPREAIRREIIASAVRNARVPELSSPFESSSSSSLSSSPRRRRSPDLADGAAVFSCVHDFSFSRERAFSGSSAYQPRHPVAFHAKIGTGSTPSTAVLLPLLLLLFLVATAVVILVVLVVFSARPRSRSGDGVTTRSTDSCAFPAFAGPLSPSSVRDTRRSPGAERK